MFYVFKYLSKINKLF